MADSKHTITDIVLVEISRLFLPLYSLDSPQRIVNLFHQLGWEFPILSTDDQFTQNLFDNIQEIVTIIQEGGPIESITTVLQDVAALIEAQTDDEKMACAQTLFQDLTATIESISSIVPQVETRIVDISENITDAPDDIRDLIEDQLNTIIDEIDDLPVRLLDYLICKYLKSAHGEVFGIFSLLGIMDYIPYPDDNPKFKIYKINWEYIPKLFIDPLSLANIVYAWENDFNSDKLLSNLEIVTRGFHLAGGLYRQTPHTAKALGFEESESNNELRFPIYQGGKWPETYRELGINISPVIEEPKKGIGIIPYLFGITEITSELVPGLEFRFLCSFDLNNGIGLILIPPCKLVFKNNLFITTDDDIDIPDFIKGRLETSIATKRDEGKDLVLIFGSEDSTCLGFGGFGVKFIFDISEQKEEISFEAELNDLTLKISPSKGDGFIQQVLSGINIESVSDIAFCWSNLEGVSFRGSSALEIVIPVHKSLGPIYITNVMIALGISGDEINTNLASSFGVELGPLTAAIDRIGLSIPINFPSDAKGNLGPLDVQTPEFLPPTGIGLSVDAEGLIGGGFVKFDTINERYSGILALAFGEISITAIGLIETKLPGGKNGFSMLVNICVEFTPPIDLSYGFTLGGIGGLIGINRIMVTEALQRGIKNHTLDSILFPDPDSVILNASKIISDMRTVFPPEEGRFIIGPMLKLGWGYPTVITGELGIFVEFPPDPLRVALMGQLNAAFPHEELGYLLINLDILGILDTEKQELTFQASLFDSAMLSYPHIFSITGDAAFLLNWGSTPDFALAVGGFHPKFDPPPPDYIFSDLRRMQMTVTYYGIVNLACKAYLALTPNTLQFGARVEIYVSQAGFDIGGAMGFDALINFSPFSFEVSICGYVWVKAQGISLMDIYIKADLSGPNPWNVNGVAKVTMLFFDFTADFSITWGDTQKAMIAAQDPLPQLIEALSSPGNWSSRLPYKRSMVETLRSFEEHEDTPDIVIVHPSGRLEIRQNAVPFNITLEKIGNAPITGHDRFKITGLEAGTKLNGKPNYVREFFGRGQFEELSNAKKLSVPSFEKMDGGVTTAASQAIRFDVNKMEDKELTYETILLNPDLTADRVGPIGKSNWDHAQKLMAGSAARLSAKKAGSNKRFKDMNMEPKATLHEERYCIVSAIDLVPVVLSEDISSKNLFNTRTEADQALDSHCSRTPGDRNEILVIPECEVPASEAIA